MSFVKNPLKKGPKRVRINENVTYEEEISTKIDFSRAIKAIAKIFYEREHSKKEQSIYSFSEMRKIFQEIESSLKDFFDQLYLAARPLEHNEQMMDRIKKLMVLICYLLASLNNMKINSFKFDLRFYLDSVDTSNEGLNTMANLGMSTTSRIIDRKKKRMSDAHGEYVEKALANHSENSFILNIDNYHNIHVQRRPDTTSISGVAHMAMIMVNPCPIPAIPRNGAINPKIVDTELITRHLEEGFIVNLDISYQDHRWDIVGVNCPDDEVIDRLMIHSYNNRLVGKKGNRHIRNAILIDFIKNDLKGIEGYMKALQIVYDQELMQEYLFNHVIPIVAD